MPPLTVAMEITFAHYYHLTFFISIDIVKYIFYEVFTLREQHKPSTYSKGNNEVILRFATSTNPKCIICSKSIIKKVGNKLSINIQIVMQSGINKLKVILYQSHHIFT